MNDDNLGPSAPEPDSAHPEEPNVQSESEPTQPISGLGWTAPTEQQGPGTRPAGSEGADHQQPIAPGGVTSEQSGGASGSTPLRPSVTAPPTSAPPSVTPPAPTPPAAPPSPWGPASPQMSPASPDGPAYAPAATTTPLAVHQETRSKGRVPGWVWPLVAALSLLLGLMGGVLGGIGYERWDKDPVKYNGGLEAVQTQDVAPLPADNGSIAAVAQALLPSTVQIIAEFGGQDEGATGSGFVLDREGHVVTNNHVVATAAEDDGPITVVDSDGVRHKATVVGRSPVYDLAILQIEDFEELEPAALGASVVLHVGDPLIAFGSPLGLSQTVTSGIVSALDRPVTTGDENNISSYINAVQTDAAINPGNSGGPLVNLAGEVVGVNSAIATTGGGGGLGGGGAGNIGVGFAIPIEQVKITADQILKTGEARYPVIGAKVRTGGADSTGALITEVTSDSPAEGAGLRKDDVVTGVDGKLVSDGIALIVAIRTHQPGDTIELTFSRDGSEDTVDVTLDGQVG